ncbi:MAG: 4-hydroxy-tetrahydrodipicolinate synthase [Ruminococcaceae bacterium]|nr:4-hydroxy-tetrahydrodipicolinate synthase [Oscillospiraceae bacterium]
MKKTVFRGAATALITPFKDGKIDYESFGRLIDFQIDGGIDALVVCGTTGEPSTLDDAEHINAMEYCIQRTAGRVPVLCGTGSNDTAYAISLSKRACEMGADALLMVTPYYNKTSQRGLVKHFNAVADSVDKPIIVYNVPGRTGLCIKPETYAELAKHPNIVAFKEAGGDMSAIAHTMALCGDELTLYSGNDDQIVPIMSLGGSGVISVLSNLIPREVHNICALFEQGKTKESLKLQLKYHDLISALFCEVNPIPVKAAMALMGYCNGELRLPLCEMEEKNAAKLASIMKELGIIK